MPEREMNPQAGNERRFRIDADAGETALDIALPADLPNNRRPSNYKVVKKDIPDAARGKTFREDCEMDQQLWYPAKRKLHGQKRRKPARSIHR